LIIIKFCKGGGDLDICKRLLPYKYYDTGDELGDKVSGGMYVYGWDTPSTTRVHMIAGVDQITEEKKDKLLNGSAAVMSKDEKGSWAIKVPQGM